MWVIHTQVPDENGWRTELIGTVENECVARTMAGRLRRIYRDERVIAKDIG